MINQITLKNFKCFEVLKLPLTGLTLLSGANASGKSSFLQSLVLLHQSVRENEWASRLMLNGNILQLGTVADVINKVHGRRDFKVTIADDDHDYSWTFSGERADMSMEIDLIRIDAEEIKQPKELSKLLPKGNLAEVYPITKLLDEMTYITAERIGPRDFYNLEDYQKVNTVGPSGENTVSILHSLRDKKIDNRLIMDSVPPTLLHQVEARMKQFFPGFGMIVEQVPRMNAVSLGLRTSDATDYHRPVHVGFGLTQVLPIIVATLSAKPGTLLLIENPEVHLHPAGQAMMGLYLAEVASAGVQVVIETHSDHVLNGIRRGVTQKVISSDQVSLHFFRQPSESEDQVISPRLDKTGNIDFWPEGFFDQFDKDISQLAGWG